MSADSCLYVIYGEPAKSKGDRLYLLLFSLWGENALLRYISICSIEEGGLISRNWLEHHHKYIDLYEVFT